MPAYFPGTLALLSVLIKELVGRSRGRPLGFFPVATGFAPDVGRVADSVATLGFLGLDERKAPGLLSPGGGMAVWMAYSPALDWIWGSSCPV